MFYLTIIIDFFLDIPEGGLLLFLESLDVSYSFSSSILEIPLFLSLCPILFLFDVLDLLFYSNMTSMSPVLANDEGLRMLFFN
jgi:hypothetical protein